MTRADDVAIFGEEEPVAIHLPDVVAIEHSHFYDGTRVVFRENNDVVVKEIHTLDVIEVWVEWATGITRDKP